MTLIVSTTLRQAWLRILGAAEIHSFVATSSLGHRFVCHVGDSLGENPFYNRGAFRAELELCAAWLLEDDHPLVFDVGANVGFWSTHLVQMLGRRPVDIFAFEPVPSTLRKLIESVERLGLGDRVHVVAAAVLDQARPVRLSYSARESQFAQVAHNGGINPRAGNRVAYAAGLTLDGFAGSLDVVPALVKVDVEGGEIDVLRGARRLLEHPNRPCLMFELNPTTLAETGADRSLFRDLLSGYALYYVDDFEGQRRPLGEPVRSLDEITWVCNLFAVPATEQGAARWKSTLDTARRRLD